jgi:hypothetical protein
VRVFTKLSQEAQSSYDQKWKKYAKSSFHPELRQELLVLILLAML